MLGITPVLEKININLYDDIDKIYSDFKIGKIDVIDVEDEDYLDLAGDFGYEKIEYEAGDFSKKTLIYSKKLYGEIAPNWQDSLYNIKTWRKIF